MPGTDIHADDYALSVNTSRDILDCLKGGHLGSISILPNMSCFRECMELLYRAVPGLPFVPEMIIHLNLVEGHSLASGRTGAVSLLVKKDSSVMRLTWSSLFFSSYLPWRRAVLKEQIKREIRVQIETARAAIEHVMEIAAQNGIPYTRQKLRIDSHQHIHMIPVVWEALTEVIEEAQLDVEYIRNAKEVLAEFVKEPSLWKTYRPVNFLKNILLSLYSHKVDRYAAMHGMEPMNMWGLIMSGRMDYDRISLLYPKVAARAEKDGRSLQLVFHPGQMLPEEKSAEIGREALKGFYLREDRHLEMDAVKRVGTLLRK